MDYPAFLKGTSASKPPSPPEPHWLWGCVVVLGIPLSCAVISFWFGFGYYFCAPDNTTALAHPIVFAAAGAAFGLSVATIIICQRDRGK